MKIYMSPMKQPDSSSQFTTIKTQKSLITQTDKQKAPSCWETMINGIVRPPRANYDNEKLGTI